MGLADLRQRRPSRRPWHSQRQVYCFAEDAAAGWCEEFAPRIKSMVTIQAIALPLTKATTTGKAKLQRLRVSPTTVPNAPSNPNRMVAPSILRICGLFRSARETHESEKVATAQNDSSGNAAAKNAHAIRFKLPECMVPKGKERNKRLTPASVPKPVPMPRIISARRGQGSVTGSEAGDFCSGRMLVAIVVASVSVRATLLPITLDSGS